MFTDIYRLSCFHTDTIEDKGHPFAAATNLKTCDFFSPCFAVTGAVGVTKGCVVVGEGYETS